MSEGDRSFATGDGHSVWEDLQAAVTGFSNMRTFKTPYAMECTLHKPFDLH